MDTVGLDGDVAVALTQLSSAVDALLAASLDPCTGEQIVGVWRQLEVQSRRLAAADAAVIGQVQSRRLPYEYGAATAASLARDVLRINLPEARARVANADAICPRVTVSGQPQPPIFPQVAAAQAAGVISRAHAAVITRTITKLPDAVQVEQGASTEEFLVTQAGIFEPLTLHHVATRISETLDPDGVLKDTAHRHRHRDFRFLPRPDGSARIEGDATAELVEYLNTVFDALAAPRPAVDGAKDDRTVGQRQHDALLELCRLGMRADLIPDAGGVTTTVILTVPAEDWADGTGLTRTGHGTDIPTTEAKQWCSGDIRIMTVAIDRLRAVQAYSDCHRFFTENQRLAMAARDGGCVFPGCDQPPQRCEAHHVCEWDDGGKTSCRNGALVCWFHHRHHQAMGWRGLIINGIPHFIPPKWIDPNQVPQRNMMHNPVPDLAPT